MGLLPFYFLKRAIFLPVAASRKHARRAEAPVAIS
jgi:hypothetical protein